MKATIVYWREIPAEIEVSDGGDTVKRPLADRFRRAVDEAKAVADSIHDASERDGWHEMRTEATGGDAQTAADALIAEIEQEYPVERLANLARHGGVEHFE